MSDKSPHQALQATFSKTLLSLHTQKVGFASLPKRSGLARVLSAKELELLELYERHLQQAREVRELETSLEEDLGRLDLGTEGGDEETLRNEVAEAKLRASTLDAIIGHAVSIRPILNAVHNKDKGDARLKTALSHRDALSTAHANTTSSTSALQARLLELTSARLQLDAQNAALAARISALWKKLEKVMPAEGTLGTEQEREGWKDDAWRVRVLRGVIGRVVVGSGIDWADDARWRELVLRCGEE